MAESSRLETLLARTELCADLSAESLQVLAGRGRRVQARAGQYLVDAGATQAPLYLIVEGSIRLTVPNIAGTEKTIATLDDGKAFGLAEFCSGRAYRYYALAQTASLLVTVPGPVMLATAELDPLLMRNLLASLGRQFDALAHDIENSNRYSAMQRVVNLLLRQASRRSADGQVFTRLPYKKSVTASRLGLAPETFSRCLTGLSERGWISVDQRMIAIHDVDSMQAMLDPD